MRGDPSDSRDRDGDGPPAPRAERIFHALRHRILRGELRPGERLPPERELARTHATNRNTLREALRRLEQAGLVAVRQGSGVVVRDYRRTGTLELLAPYLEHAPDGSERARALLDLLGARTEALDRTLVWVAERARDADVAHLEALANRQVDAYERGARRELAEGDLAWHDALFEAAHSLPIRWIANTFLEVYRGLLDRMPDLWLVDPGYLDYLRGVTEALAARDGERARRAARAFYERTDRTLHRALERLLSGADRGAEGPDVGRKPPSGGAAAVSGEVEEG